MNLPLNLLRIELTNICNNKCIFCYHKFLKRKKSVMSLAMVKMIADKFVSHLEFDKVNNSEPCIILHGFGEIFLIPHIVDIIKVFIEKDCCINLSSNFDMKEEHVRFLEETASNVRFGLVANFSGITDAEYGIKMANKNFIKVVNNINRILELGKNIFIVYNKIVTEVRSNEEILAGMHRLFPKAKTIVINDVHNWGYPELLYGKSISTRLYKTENNNVCEQIARELQILCNGDINTCCFDIEGRNIYANINDSIAEIEYKRNGLIGKELTLCKICKKET